LFRPLYRGRQVLKALRPGLQPAAIAAVAVLLSPAETRLFLQMEKRDQRHAIEVMRRLEAAGCQSPELLAAALLHDCGKGAVPVWLRILNVLSPGLLRHLAAEGSSSWRADAYRLAHHPRLGADLALAAGAHPTTARLISGRVRAEESEALALLHRADDAS
jgi:hypothetical protein